MTATFTSAAHIARTPHRRALILLLLTSTLAVMAGATIAPVVDVMRAELGINATSAGLILTLHALAIAITSPLVGWLIDRFGVRVPLATGLLIYGAAGAAGLFLTSYPSLLVSRAIFGIGAAFVFSGTSVAILNIYRGDQRDRVMGWRTTATSLGGVIFPLVSGGLAVVFSWHAAFALYLVGIPMGLLALAVIPETRSQKASSAAAPAPAIVFSPTLVGIYALVLIQAVMLYALIAFLPVRLGDLGHGTPVLASVYMAVLAGTSSVVGVSYGWLGRRLSYSALLCLTAGTWIVAFLMLGLSEDLILVGVASAVLGIGNALAFSTTSVMLDDSVPQARLGSAMAIFSVCMFLGQFVSPLALGPLVEATSIPAGYLFLSGVGAVVLAVLWCARSKGPLGGGEMAETGRIKQPTDRPRSEVLSEIHSRFMKKCRQPSSG